MESLTRRVALKFKSIQYKHIYFSYEVIETSEYFTISFITNETIYKISGFGGEVLDCFISFLTMGFQVTSLHALKKRQAGCGHVYVHVDAGDQRMPT